MSDTDRCTCYGDKHASNCSDTDKSKYTVNGTTTYVSCDFNCNGVKSLTAKAFLKTIPQCYGFKANSNKSKTTQYECPGHRNISSDNITYVRYNSKHAISSIQISSIQEAIVNEIEQRRNHAMYANLDGYDDPIISSSSCTISNTMIEASQPNNIEYAINNVRERLNELSDAFMYILAQAWDTEHNVLCISADPSLDTAPEDIRQKHIQLFNDIFRYSTVSANAKSNTLSLLMVELCALHHDCICYADCIAYYKKPYSYSYDVCNCNVNCGCNY